MIHCFFCNPPKEIQSHLHDLAIDPDLKLLDILPALKLIGTNGQKYIVLVPSH